MCIFRQILLNDNYFVFTKTPQKPATSCASENFGLEFLSDQSRIVATWSKAS